MISNNGFYHIHCWVNLFATLLIQTHLNRFQTLEVLEEYGAILCRDTVPKVLRLIIAAVRELYLLQNN